MSDWQWRPSGPSGASQVHKASMRNWDFVRTMTAFPFCPCNPQQSSMCKDPVKNIEHQLRYQVKEQKCMLPIYSWGGRDQSPACPQGAGPGGRLFFRLAGLCSCFLWAMLFRTSQVTISPLHVLCLVIQSCLILCNPMDCSPPGFSVHEDSPGKNTEVGCHAFLREPSQHWEDPLHCRQVLYRLSHQCISYKGGCAYSVNIVTLSISTCTQAHEMRDRICMLCPISHTS